MKKIIALLLSGILLLSAASCEKKDEIPFDYDLSKYITLGEYKGMTYVPARTEPTDYETWERIIEILDYCGLYAEEVYPDYLYSNLTEGTVLFGDIVKMNISLSVEGNVYESCVTSDFVTEIGGNFFTANITSEYAEEMGISYDFLTQFMTDIEIAAVDKEIGSEYTLSGEFPTDNFANDLIGKSYVITASVTEVTTRYGHPDTVEEDILEELGSYEDFGEYRDYVEEELEDGGYSTAEGEIWHWMCYEFKQHGFYNHTLYDYYGENIETGTVKNGDIVNIDFKGYVDGEIVDKACAEDYTLEIGSNSFIPGFEDGLIGAVIGNTVTLNLTFPEEYHNAELAGKPVKFDVTVNVVEYRYGHPEELSQVIIDQLVDYGMTSGESFEEFWNEAYEEVKTELEEAAETQKTTDVWNAVVKNSTLISYPKNEIKNYMDEYEEYYGQLATYYGYESLDALLEYMDVTYDEFIEEGNEMAKDQVFEMMIMYQIARAEGFDKLEESVYEEKAQKYVDYYGVADYATLCEQAGKYIVKEWVMADMVTQLVCDNAVAVSE